MHEVAVSTVAASLLGVLSVHGPMRLDQAVHAMSTLGFHSTQGAAAEAAQALVQRDMISTTNEGVLASFYPEDWVMVARDAGDETGWSGWVMRNIRSSEQRPLSDLEKV